MRDCNCDICCDVEDGDDGELAALRLLHQHITRYQREKLHRGFGLMVKGGVSGDKYRIDAGGCVTRLSDDHEFCLYVRDVPQADDVLAKKILIENDESRFLRVANDLTVGQR